MSKPKTPKESVSADKEPDKGASKGKSYEKPRLQPQDEEREGDFWCD